MIGLLKFIYLLLPAYIANMAPVLCKPVFPWLKHPLDFNLKLKGKRLLGDHKTWRGLVIGVFAATLTAYVQVVFSPKGWLLQPYNFVLIGPLLGFGALVGDAIKSFFKRRINIRPGKDWVPFDQVDFIVGALIAIAPFYAINLVHAVIIIVLSAIGHVIIKEAGRLLRLT